MKLANRIVVSVAALLLPVAAHAQTYGLAAPFQQIYFSTSGTSPGPGLPLAGGFVYTCNSGSACPGTPQASYSDSSGFTQNQNPVTLGANGTPVNGSTPVGIWLNCSLNYKIVLQDANNVTVQTTDNVSCGSSGGGGGGGTNFWTLVGSAITNNNGSGTGAVNIGASLNVGTNLAVVGTISLADSEATSKFAVLRAPAAMTATTQWLLPPADAAGCLTSDGSGNLSFQTCGSGGGGSPGGSNTAVQFNSSSVFGGSTKFTWNNTAQLLTITAQSASDQGIVVLTGYIQSDNGFAAVNNLTPTTPLNYNVIQAPYGGMAANSFTATAYTEIGNSTGVPPATSSEPGYPHAGAMYCDTTSPTCTPKLYNGSAWVSMATGGATSPGGSDTQIQINSSGSFGASGNLFFASQELVAVGTSLSNPVIYGSTGFIQSDYGFLALPATATHWNTIQAPGGGLAALSGTFSNYTQIGNSNGLPSVTNSGTLAVAGTMYCDTATNPCILKFYNGTAWANVAGTGGTSPGGTDVGGLGSIQWNLAGVFAGDSLLAWDHNNNTIFVNTITRGLVILNGYAQTDVGFLAINNANPSTPLQYNAIQTPTGGVYANSVRAIKYSQSGNSSGIPSVTSGDSFQPGAFYWDTGTGTWKVYGGSGPGWLTVSTGAGVGSLNTLTGSLNIACAASTSCTVGASGTTVTITAPQPLATSSNVTFATVVANDFNSPTATCSSFAFQTQSGNYFVTCAGGINGQTLNVNTGAFASTLTNAIATAGGANLCSGLGCAGGSALSIGGTTVATSGGAWTSLLNMSTSGSSSNIFTGSLGNFYTRQLPSSGISCTGIANGWLAVSSDLYVVVCISGTRYRAALASY